MALVFNFLLPNSDCVCLAGIFAFKCARAEEIFNMLQDIMHNNSISVVEEPVMEPELPIIPHSPTSKDINTHTHTQSMHLRIANSSVVVCCFVFGSCSPAALSPFVPFGKICTRCWKGFDCHKSISEIRY